MTKVQLIPNGSEALAAMEPSSYVTADALREGDPAERHLVHLISADQKFMIGTWQAQPYAEFVESYPGDEYTLILEGQVTLTDPDGTHRTYGAGSSFTISAGWSGEYRVDTPLTKQFVFYTNTPGEESA